MTPGHLLTSFRINDDTILDAGSMAQSLPLEEQLRIRHVLLTHSHLDHTGSLPFFAENIFGHRERAVVVHSIRETIESVRTHLFNDTIWPDFSTIPDIDRAPIRFNELEEGTPALIDSLTVTAVRVNHTVPAVGYLIDDGRSAVLFTGDTGPTERIWEIASRHSRLAAVFVETSLPNRLQDIADAAGHFTPQTLLAELSKLERDVPKLVYHIKPGFHAEIVAEIESLRQPRLSIVEQGRDYDF